MIKVSVIRNQKHDICGFTVKNHGASYVCAAVSILVINTINSIEHFVGEPIKLKMKDSGGYIDCLFPRIKDGEHNHDVNLLLNTMLFGLTNVQHEHGNDICIFDKEVSP